MKVASRAEIWKEEWPVKSIEKLSLMHWRAHNWLSKRCWLITESWETEWLEDLQEWEKAYWSWANLDQNALFVILIRITFFKIDRQFFRFCKSSNHSVSHYSVIGQHLLYNQLCALQYINDSFSIFFTGRSSFHISVLEATFIRTIQPNLRRQKEFVYSL